MTPVIGTASGVTDEAHANLRALLIKSHQHGLIIDCGPPTARELRIKHKQSMEVQSQTKLHDWEFSSAPIWL